MFKSGVHYFTLTINPFPKLAYLTLAVFLQYHNVNSIILKAEMGKSTMTSPLREESLGLQAFPARGL